MAARRQRWMGEAGEEGGPRLHVWVVESVCKRRRGGSVAQHLNLCHVLSTTRLHKSVASPPRSTPSAVKVHANARASTPFGIHAAPMVESSRGQPAIASGHPPQPPTPPPPSHRLPPAVPTDTALPTCTAAATAHATGVPTATNTPPLPPDCPLNVARPEQPPHAERLGRRVSPSPQAHKEISTFPRRHNPRRGWRHQPEAATIVATGPAHHCQGQTSLLQEGAVPTQAPCEGVTCQHRRRSSHPNSPPILLAAGFSPFPESSPHHRLPRQLL